MKHHFKIPYNIKQKNVKNVKKVQQYFKIPYNIQKKLKKQPTSFFRHYNTSVAKIQETGAQKISSINSKFDENYANY